MPYQTNSDLPASVTENIPAHAQDIYREGRTREETVHAVAWSAVQQKYKKTKTANGLKKTNYSTTTAFTGLPEAYALMLSKVVCSMRLSASLLLKAL